MIILVEVTNLGLRLKQSYNINMKT